MKVVIIMGSKSDLEFASKIGENLKKFGIEFCYRIASAHKTPEKVLQIIKEYKEGDVVFITVAGRSNALSGFVDANTSKPVIACPPYSEKFAGLDVLSSLRMPSGVGAMVVLEPENATLAAAKILAMQDKSLEGRIEKYQREKKEEIEKANETLDC
jgi:5-(carboxyamino)imidazole ribonucleotide mutase